MKTNFFCDHCNDLRHGETLDTKYAVNKLFERVIKCFTCHQITIDYVDLSENKEEVPDDYLSLARQPGCHTRWIIRQKNS